MGFTILEAPSVLGLFPGGVENLSTALLDAGLLAAVRGRYGSRLESPAYSPRRDPVTGVLNPSALASYTLALADATGLILDAGEVPLVLGGDCSILLGTMLALRRRGRYGLLFIDAHADFYQPEADPRGEVASMELAMATGRGPELLTNPDNLRPLVADEDVVHVGRRDAEEAAMAGSQSIEESGITLFDLDYLRLHGVRSTAWAVVDQLTHPGPERFWIHLDCDAIDDSLMPAVDYRLPGGMDWSELEFVIRAAFATGKVCGIEITIFNPSLDPDGSLAANLVSSIGRAVA